MGALALTCRGSRRLQLLSVYEGGQPPPTGSGVGRRCPTPGRTGCQARNPASDSEEGPRHLPGYSGCKPASACLPAPPPLLLPPPGAAVLTRWDKRKTWSVLTAPPRRHPAASPSPLPGLLFPPAPRLGLKPDSKHSPPPPPLPSTSRALMQLCGLRPVIFGNSAQRSAELRAPRGARRT